LRWQHGQRGQELVFGEEIRVVSWIMRDALELVRSFREEGVDEVDMVDRIGRDRAAAVKEFLQGLARISNERVPQMFRKAAIAHMVEAAQDWSEDQGLSLPPSYWEVAP
jgi:hypothetical protein